MIQYCHKTCQVCSETYVCDSHPEELHCGPLCRPCEQIKEQRIENVDITIAADEYYDRMYADADIHEEDFYNPEFLE